MRAFLKKFFGIKPGIGDWVMGMIDPGIYYIGVVVKMPANKDVPYYTVRAKVTIYTDRGTIIQNEEKEMFIPKSKVNHI